MFRRSSASLSASSAAISPMRKYSRREYAMSRPELKKHTCVSTKKPKNAASFFPLPLKLFTAAKNAGDAR